MRSQANNYILLQLGHDRAITKRTDNKHRPGRPWPVAVPLSSCGLRIAASTLRGHQRTKSMASMPATPSAIAAASVPASRLVAAQSPEAQLSQRRGRHVAMLGRAADKATSREAGRSHSYFREILSPRYEQELRVVVRLRTRGDGHIYRCWRPATRKLSREAARYKTPQEPPQIPNSRRSAQRRALFAERCLHQKARS